MEKIDVQIAYAALRTMTLREAIWNKEAFLLEEERLKRKYPDKKDNPFYTFPDPAQFYHWTEKECAVLVCKKMGLPESLASLISLAMYWSNDLWEWAIEVINNL